VNDVTYSKNNVTDRTLANPTFAYEIGCSFFKTDTSNKSHFLYLILINFVNAMRSLFYIISLLLILAWSIGFIGYGIGGIFHILLVFALLSIVMRVILEKKSSHKYSA
jgi:hypothetical protein